MMDDIVYIPTIDQKIEELKDQITATDYKIIKCYEYQLVGLELPYDLTQLHADRQILRDQINELEVELQCSL